MEQQSKIVGRAAGRFIKTLMLSRGYAPAANAYLDSQRWVEAPQIKSAIGANRLSDLPGSPVVNDFLDCLRPASILSRLDSARRCPLETRILAFGAGAVGYLVDEGKAMPLSAGSLSGVTITPRKFGAMLVCSDELLAAGAPGTESALARDLAAAVGLREDETLVNPALPGSLLYGAPSAASTGTSLQSVDADIAAAIGFVNASGSSLSNAVFIVSSAAAVRLSLLRGANGSPAYPNIGATGGTICGMPVLVSDSAAGKLILLDQAGILISQEEAIDLQYSTSSTLEMSNTPAASSVSPTGATSMVSMFQTDCTAVKTTLLRGWFCRPGAAAYIVGGLF